MKKKMLYPAHSNWWFFET